LDSATTAAIALREGLDVHALTMLYGQRHAIEGEAAKRVVAALEIPHHVIQTIDLRAFGGSALTADIDVPKSGVPHTESSAIPITYVPARNTILLAHALAYAEVLEAQDIFIGVNAVDFSGYPDCRPAFIQAFQNLVKLATRAGEEGHAPTIQAPLLYMSKAQIIRRGQALGVDYALTHSCYDPDEQGRACARCESCVLRRDGFAEAGVPDPTIYRSDAATA
jgi:7-cyano-7-deazaguanine synthase